MRIVFSGTSYSDMKRMLLVSRDESCALLLASSRSAEAGRASLLVREIYPAPDSAYLIRTGDRAELRPDFLVPLVQKAREKELSVIFVHTHPGVEDGPRFSELDDRGEVALHNFVSKRVPGAAHAALVVGSAGCSARVLGTSKTIGVVQVGANVESVYVPGERWDNNAMWDRQRRAFGAEGQAAVRRARVAIVGLGGTGSVVAQELSHLGVSDFILVDPDVIDATNLNRVVGSRKANIGRAKTEVAAGVIREINPDAVVECLHRDVADVDVALGLTEVDAIFGCTDSHASRAVLNQLAYQYYVPFFDVGIGIVVEGGGVTSISGRVQMASPGLPCLICSGVIDANAVRRELQSETERAADPYISGVNEPQPAVMSLNATVASLCVTMFMSAFTPVPGQARLQFYNGMTGNVRAAELRADPSCIVCSLSGALGRGRYTTLPGRTGTR